MSAGLVGAALALTLAVPARAGETPTAAPTDTRPVPAADVLPVPAAGRHHGPDLGWRLTPTGSDARFRGL
ncbi:oxidoreductase, partial [Streptomyces cinereoruber]